MCKKKMSLTKSAKRKGVVLSALEGKIDEGSERKRKRKLTAKNPGGDAGPYAKITQLPSELACSSPTLPPLGCE